MTGSMGAMRRPLPAALSAALVAGVAAVLVALSGLVAATPSYAATSCPAFSEASAKKADAVFDGRVSGPARTTKGSQAVTYPVTVQNSYQGTASGSLQVHINGGPCQPKRLVQDEDYVFLVSHSTSGWVAAGATRSVMPYTEQLNQRLHALFDEAEPPQPTGVTFGAPLTGPPSSLARVAAPGVAMFIVGLLGYLVVRRLGRRAT